MKSCCSADQRDLGELFFYVALSHIDDAAGGHAACDGQDHDYDKHDLECEHEVLQKVGWRSVR